MTLNRWIAVLIVTGAPLYSQVLFAPRADYGNITGATASTVADFNSDGLPDIAVGAGTSVYLLVQNANPRGTFLNWGAVANTGTGNTITAIASGDLNGDGIPDLVVSTTNGLFYFLGAGNFTFGAAQSLGSCVANVCGTIVLGTFNTNNNPYLDILVMQDLGVTVYLGNGTGGFGAGTLIHPCQGSNVAALAAGDFNNDGKLDFICGETVYLGNGNGTFTESATVNLVIPYYDLAAEFNTDGNLDVAGIAPGVAAVYPGNGNGTFGSGLTTSLGEANETAGGGTADFNLDGHLDLAVYDASSPGTLDIFLGEGTGLFQTTPIGLQACSATNTEGVSNAITVSDLNGDGIADVIVSCNSGNTVSLFLSLAPSVFLQASQGNSTAGQSITLTAVVGSPAQGFLYVNGYQVQFYDGSATLGAPVSLANGQAALTLSTLAQGIHYITAGLIGPGGNTVATSATITEVVSKAGCAINDTAKLDILPGTVHHNRTTGLYTQTVRVTNISDGHIEGPIEMALTDLPAGVTVVNPAGYTSGVCGFPSGAPLVDMGVCAGGTLGSGKSISFTVEFTDPSATTITYQPLALESYGPR